MRGLLFAIRAFCTILRNKPCIFVNQHDHCIIGHEDDIEQFINVITVELEDETHQIETLLEAKKILQTKIK